MIRWVIYYPDGTRYNSQDGPPWRSPKDPVIGVCQANDKLGREICYGDWYCYHDPHDIWTFHDRDGVMAQMVYGSLGISCVRQGWFVADPAQWEMWVQKMKTDDNGLPAHSAFPPGFRMS